MSENNAINDAYEQQIRLMYAVLVDALVQSSTDFNANEASQRFRKGLSLARKAKEMALGMISETL